MSKETPVKDLQCILMGYENVPEASSHAYIMSRVDKSKSVELL